MRLTGDRSPAGGELFRHVIVAPVEMVESGDRRPTARRQGGEHQRGGGADVGAGDVRAVQASDATDACRSATHGDVGAYLLDLWGLPESVTKAVALHHEPIAEEQHDNLTPLAIVHVANHFAHDMDATTETGAGDLDFDFLEVTKLADRVPIWREAIDQTSQQAVV